ncbi:hypothetical protein [Actinomadura rubteroloni]|nr:hypothetical protein [Actinomadura rubteroloni]
MDYPRIIPAPAGGGLPFRDFGAMFLRGGPAWWFLACHGGAGSTTLYEAIPGGMDAGRWWPLGAPPTAMRVVLVTRSHAHGLRSAQAAAHQWSRSPELRSVDLLGLAVIADAPGRRPRPLRDLLELVSGGVPRVWDLPWVEEMRLGTPPAEIQLPAPYLSLAADLRTTTTGEQNG